MNADEMPGMHHEKRNPASSKEEGSQSPEPEPRPTIGQRFGMALGCLGGIIAILFFAGYLFAGCESVHHEVIRPRVIDSANALADTTVRRIEALQFPTDVPVLIRTVKKIAPDRIGSFATDSMEEETQWQVMRPRGFLRRTFRQDSPSSTAVYVLVSEEPALLQIRYGKQMRLAAYRSGIACGEWYIAQQRVDAGQSERHLLQTLTDLEPRLARAMNPSWLTRKLQTLASLVWSEFEDFMMPSDNFLADAALKNYVRLISALGGTGSVWRFLLATFGCYLVLWVGLKKLLVDRFLLPRVQSLGARWGIEVTSTLTLAGFLATGFAALVFLGRGRIEDQMALDYLGLSGLGKLGLDPVTFARPGGLWFALPVAILVFFKDMLEHNIVNAEPHTRKLSLGFLCWAAVFYLMPKAICVFALFILVLQTISVVVSVARSELPSGTQEGTRSQSVSASPPGDAEP